MAFSRVQLEVKLVAIPAGHDSRNAGDVRIDGREIVLDSESFQFSNVSPRVFLRALQDYKQLVKIVNDVTDRENKQETV